MACYVILIGGTGHRVGKGILQLAAAGCVPAGELKIMCIDSDGGNQDFALFKRQFEQYQKLDRKNVFTTKVTTKNNALDELCWSPLEKTGSMRDILSKSFMSPDSGAKLLDFLYTDFEQQKTLTEGFYGHTSIGSLFMANQIMDNQTSLTPDWEAFLTGISDGDKVFIVGSAFGGTGASGVPTIAQILKNYRNGLDIAALLVMPYFKFNYQDDGIIDFTTFTTKTKAAMSFYDKQNFDQKLKTLYVIGEDVDLFMTVNYSEGGQSQANNPNPIELCAATALIDFLADAGDIPFSVRLMTRDTEGQKLLVSQNMLNLAGRSGSFMRLAAFMKLCVMYTKYYYHHLKSGKANGAWIDKYKGISSEEAEDLYNYCMNFIDWIKFMHYKTDENGRLVNGLVENVRLFRFGADYFSLYNGMPISAGLLGEKLGELDGVAGLVYGENNGKKGSEIISLLNSEEPADADSPISRFYRTLLKICGN